MYIVPTDMVTDFSSSMSSTTAAADMGADQLKVLQMSRRCRLTSILNTPHVQYDAGGNYSDFALQYDTVAILGYDGNPTQNLHRNGMRINQWTGGTGSVGISFAAPPAELSFPPWEANPVTNLFNLQDTFQKTGKGASVTGASSETLRSGVFVRQKTAKDIDLRISAYSTVTTDQADVDFDLSAGIAGTGNSAGGFTFVGAAIETLSDGWYLCTMDYTTDNADTVTVKYEAIESGSTTVVDGWTVGLPVTSLASAGLSSTLWPSLQDTGAAVMFRVRLGVFSVTSAEIVADRTAWAHAVSTAQNSLGTRFHFVHRYDDIKPHPTVRVELYDPYNSRGYAEMGRMVVGRAVDLTSNVFRGTPQISVDQRVVEQEAQGGQVYISESSIRRVWSVDLVNLTRERALLDIYLMQRQKGRHTPILAVLDDQDRYRDNTAIYGYVSSVDSIAQPVNGKYTWRMEITEAL